MQKHAMHKSFACRHIECEFNKKEAEKKLLDQTNDTPKYKYKIYCYIITFIPLFCIIFVTDFVN